MCDVWRRAQRRPAAMDERPGGGLRDEECFGDLVNTLSVKILFMYMYIYIYIFDIHDVFVIYIYTTCIYIYIYDYMHMYILCIYNIHMNHEKV